MGRQGAVPRRPSTRQTPSFSHGQDPSSSTNQNRYSAPQPDILAPIRAAPTNLKRNHYSTPSALNAIRDDLSDKLPGGRGVMQAWHSNPSSRTSSRNPSRQSSSRNPRPAVHGRTSSYDSSETNQDELVFHDVRSNTLPRSKKPTFSISDSCESIASTLSPLPSIIETSSVQVSKRKRSNSPTEKKNGFTRSETVEIRTELGGDNASCSQPQD